MSYDPQVGDIVDLTRRVKVVGIYPAGDNGFNWKAVNGPGSGTAGSTSLKTGEISAVLVERPLPPEPVWRVGDVIRVRSYGRDHFLIKAREGWHCSCSLGGESKEPDKHVSHYWKRGDVEILKGPGV